MVEKGYLSSDQMAGAFAMLRAVGIEFETYWDTTDSFMGDRGNSFDLMA